MGRDFSDLPALSKRIRNWFNGRSLEREADDAVQEYWVGILEGKRGNQTVGQYCIDYCRTALGDGRGPSALERQALLNGCPLGLGRIPDPSPRIERLELRMDLIAHIQKLPSRRLRRIAARMAMDWDMAEIAKAEGMSPSRASQMLAQIEAHFRGREVSALRRRLAKEANER